MANTATLRREREEGGPRPGKEDSLGLNHIAAMAVYRAPFFLSLQHIFSVIKLIPRKIFVLPYRT
jgi:hypothetical protein